MFERLFNGGYTPEEARALLIQLYERGESSQEIAEAARLMRERSIKLPIPEELRRRLIDIVGTGGDRSGSFNVSTTVALLLPALGSYVAKHGNRSVTSKSGSADMLEALGINLDLTPQQEVELLERTGFTFIFAKNHHPIMKEIMPIRKSIPHRTIFNLIGPLTNPGGSEKFLLGVFSREFVPKMAQALVELGTERALVVSSADGLDEISISDRTYCAEVRGEKIEEYEIAPEDFGLPRAPREEILGGDPRENGEITRGILEGRVGGAKRNMVLLNAGAALMVDGKAGSIQEGIEMAMEAIDDGRAREKLEEIIEVSRSISATPPHPESGGKG
ncbi:MAG: anthranilate phosphoribosyltransferase [Epsilonproteobacteria bacterium]|nr:anthranilate phosphoribosyltransferase [Campylobacterota bacterium]NPA57520.1 anthranilate phosphoribosyltransferase [Campylobacterota bacterium]